MSQLLLFLVMYHYIKKGNPSAIVSCVGTIKNVYKGIKNIAKKKSIAIVIGDRPIEVGGTEFSQTQKGSFLPAKIDFSKAEKLSFAIINAIKLGYIDSSSVINEGGLVTTFLHTCIKSNLGFKGNFEKFNLGKLFSEGNGFLVSVLPKYQQKLIEFLNKEKIYYSVLGNYIDHETIDAKIFTLNRSILKKRWNEGLRNLVF
jgi:phosphoribosylformylglycinamidine (FGAM) synthase-like enzyme